MAAWVKLQVVLAVYLCYFRPCNTLCSSGPFFFMAGKCSELSVVSITLKSHSLFDMSVYYILDFSIPLLFVSFAIFFLDIQTGSLSRVETEVTCRQNFEIGLKDLRPLVFTNPLKKYGRLGIYI